MAFFLSSGPACFDNSWPEERLLTHLLRSAAAAPPEVFKSLLGSHPVDVLQSKSAYELRTDAPGVVHDDISVEVHEDVLKISTATAKPSPTSDRASAPSSNPDTTPAEAEARPSSPPGSAWKLVRRERSQPHGWTRAFLLPEDADVESVSVRLEQGVLTVHVPRRTPPPKPQPRRIRVNSQ